MNMRIGGVKTEMPVTHSGPLDPSFALPSTTAPDWPDVYLPEQRGKDADQSDPDPFSIGLGVFAAIAGGGAFLEACRQRRLMERQQRERFRATWFHARRTLIHFARIIDEFETYMLEDAYANQSFRIGVVRISVDGARHQALRRLKGQALTTANVLSDALDDLSDFLGPEDQTVIDKILDHLKGTKIPDKYSDVIIAARRASDLYEKLLTHVDERERFEEPS